MAFGQHGSAFITTTGTVTPPLGKVIVAITFLATNTPTALVAEDPDTIINTERASHNESSATVIEGTGGEEVSGSFPAGLTSLGDGHLSLRLQQDALFTSGQPKASEHIIIETNI